MGRDLPPNSRYLPIRRTRQMPVKCQLKHLFFLILSHWLNWLVLVVCGSSPQKQYKALYSYTASEADEVSLQEGDLISDVEPIDDGWMFGRNLRTGQRGMLPANYVRPVWNKASASQQTLQFGYRRAHLHRSSGAAHQQDLLSLLSLLKNHQDSCFENQISQE